jgi:hypothetical protein
MNEVEFWEGDVTCECGVKFHLYWNGGELDQYDCKCGRKHYTEARSVVLVTLEPGEKRPAAGAGE